MAWNPTGDLIATGSNDKTIKLAGFDMQRQVLTGKKLDCFGLGVCLRICVSVWREMSFLDKNIELRIHHDTIRDVVFMNQPKSTANVMISGAGDGKIIMTDCGPATPIKEFNDHTGAVLSLHTWGGAMFVSGSMDKTCRLWDVRKPSATKIIDAKTGCPG
jgi:WD repeat-containing protein 47